MAAARRRALAFALVGLGAAAAGLWLGRRLGRAPEAPGREAVTPLAAAVFRDLEGRARVIAEWRGKVVVVNFWASWCAPCLEEIPMLARVRDSEAYRGIEFVGIAIDIPSKVAEFAAKMRISYPVLIADGSGLDLIRGLGNTAGGLPYTVFLDRAGLPVRAKLGALSEQELRSILAGLAG
jgi:thiol-disulfide isomerase/thioredoxin